MLRHRLLVIDDEPHMIWLLKESFQDDFEVAGALRCADALKIVENEKVDIILLDLRLGKLCGLEVLDRIRKLKPTLPVIIVTAYASITTAVSAMKIGACDYIEKPFSLDHLRAILNKALGLYPEQGYAEVSEDLLRNKIVTRSKEMAQVWGLIKKVAPTDASVLITGESGTGKEVVARAIHFESKRHKKPFLAINCAAVPENLLESELFGYEAGAFTGARISKPGKLEMAGEGTLVLDEIGDMPLSLQAKLLRVLEERSIERLGSSRQIRVDVRVISITNKNLADMIKEKKFKEDLFFRLNVFPIHLPPLRERSEDVKVLAEHFLEQYAVKHGKQFVKSFHPLVMEKLSSYTWPGNIRELKNLVEQIVIMSEKEQIRLEDIPFSFGELHWDAAYEDADLVSHSPVGEPGRSGKDGGRYLLKTIRREAELKAIEEALHLCRGNRTKAAALLGISRRALQIKLKDTAGRDQGTT